jgi:hypothetical protein
MMMMKVRRRWGEEKKLLSQRFHVINGKERFCRSSRKIATAREPNLCQNAGIIEQEKRIFHCAMAEKEKY